MVLQPWVAPQAFPHPLSCKFVISTTLGHELIQVLRTAIQILHDKQQPLKTCYVYAGAVSWLEVDQLLHHRYCFLPVNVSLNYDGLQLNSTGDVTSVARPNRARCNSSKSRKTQRLNRDLAAGRCKTRSVARVDCCFVAEFARWTAQIVAIFMVDATGRTSTTCGIPQTATVDGSVRQER